MDLSLERWRSLREAEQLAEARRLEKRLPQGFHFADLRTFETDQDHRIASFRFEGATFVLVPSTMTTIGFDTGRDWLPTPEEEESWEDTGAEYGFASTIQEYVEEVTLRPRSVVTHALLVETEAQEVGWEKISFNDPAAHVESHGGGVGTTIRTCRDGSRVVERSLPVNYHDVARLFAGDGFRLPTSDEWEFLCGCGSPTLFRWGDHVPCDRYPTDVSSNWNLHHRPNLFGLLIAFDPYRKELVAEPGLTRGGDGGSTICGGAGFFVGWLPLATAYFEEDFCQHDPNETIQHGCSVARRVLDLS